MKAIPSQRGGALVEFAVVLPVAMIFLFGIIQLGILVYDMHAVGNAANLGARWAMTRGGSCLNTAATDAQGNAICPASTAAIQYYVQQQVPGLTASSLGVTPHWFTDSTEGTACNTQDVGCVVKVDVTYPFNFSIPFWGSKNIPITATSEMTITD